MSEKRLSYENIKWDKYFYYDESSPSCLRWKIKHSRKVVKDSPVGTKVHRATGSPNCWALRLDGVRYQLHRVVFLLHNPSIELSGKVIDHIDGNPFNNRIENLRLATHQENCKNLSIKSNNTSGITNISKVRNPQGTEYWRSSIKHNGKFISKCFSIDGHGDVAAKEMAAEYLNYLKQKYGYTDRHGT